MREYESCEMAISIALLNMKYDVEITRPSIARTSTNTFYRINFLTRNNNQECIEIGKMIKDAVSSLVNEDKDYHLHEKTIKRRLENYKVYEEIHTIIKVLEKEGCIVETKEINKKLKRTKLSISRLCFDDFILEKEEIITKGKEIITILDAMMDRENDISNLSETSDHRPTTRKRTFVLKRGNTEFMEILLRDIKQNPTID